MGDPCTHKGTKVLLVEGANDCHVIMALCAHFNIPETFGIHACGSDRQVLKRADGLLRAPTENPIHKSKHKIGLVLDADEAAADFRWQEIQKLMDLGAYTIPEKPGPDGTILTTAELPRLGIWIMPNNADPGRLEDFLLEMAPPDAIQLAQACVTLAETQEIARFNPIHRRKAEIHTYLAWQEEPGSPLGRSITQHALQPDTPTAQIFSKWLRQLFDDES
ncbi:MAG: hypothetical protein HQL99_13750 [Magnetococcales bacterium]|nr:hypothetical protein [Magnetococcales bacterium]